MDHMERNMEIAIKDAKAKLTKLVAAVEAGEAVTITRRGVPVADIVPHRHIFAPDKTAVLDKYQGSVSDNGAGVSTDFLYDNDGLPK